MKNDITQAGKHMKFPVTVRGRFKAKTPNVQKIRKPIRERIKYSWKYYRYCADGDDQQRHFDHLKPRWYSGTIFGYLGFLIMPAWIYDVWFWMLAIKCKKHGHQWIEDGWAGPDSGGIAMHCSRCGYSFKHPLY